MYLYIGVKCLFTFFKNIQVMEMKNTHAISVILVFSLKTLHLYLENISNAFFNLYIVQDFLGQLNLHEIMKFNWKQSYLSDFPVIMSYFTVAS